MPAKTYHVQNFCPTASRSGSNSPSALRGRNMFFRGEGDNTFLECYGGSLDLDEPLPAVAITSTITFTTTSFEIVGSGTAFLDEINHPGQKLLTLAGTLLVVKEVIDDEHFIVHELPLAAERAVAAYRLQRLFAVGTKRGALLSGNILGTDRGNFIGVGSGDFYLNGQQLNDNFEASKNTQIAIYQPATDDFLIISLGFDTVPVGIVVSVGAAPASKTFADTDINTGTDIITVTGHGWVTGQAIGITNPGTFFTSTPQVAQNQTVYFIRSSANTGKLAETLADAVGGVAIDITAAGSGTFTVAPVSKNMPVGDRSLRISKASTKTGDATANYGNPGAKIPFSLSGVGQTAKIDFPAMDSNADPNDPHNAWRVNGTRYGGSTTTSTAAAVSGPWYYVRTITAEELGGTGAATFYLEYLDAEVDAVARVLTFDNDFPPDAAFFAALGEVLLLVSCSGPRNTSPGNSIVSFKTGNLAAAPLVRDDGQRGEIPTSPPEVIIGFYIAAGRLYLMCSNTLQIGVFTAQTSFPVATRPFWQSGFSNPDALCFFDYQLFGFTNQPIRSPAEGTADDVDKDFANDVIEITYNWHPSRVMTKPDATNKNVCYIYSAAYKNDDGWWVSLILPFGKRGWHLPFVIESSEHDMIISGADSVNNNLEFIAGGRDGAGGIALNTYRFDGGLSNGDTVRWATAPQFSDDGAENQCKTVSYPSVRAKGTNMEFSLFAAEPGETVPVDALDNHSGSKTGAIPLADSTEVTIYPRIPVQIRNAMEYTWLLTGEYDGSVIDSNGFSVRDRIDEVALESRIQGARH